MITLLNGYMRFMRPENKYIAVEGVIGVGKTSLASMLAHSFQSHLILEAFKKNPFLEKFYGDRQRFAFQTQIFFLLARYEQQKKLRQPDLFQSLIITDYLFDKDRIFATMNLSEKELYLYDGIARLIEPDIAVPDLVIYLQASSGRLMDHIRKRGRPYEKDIDTGYIQSLNRLYDQFFGHFTKAPVIGINTDDMDFVNSDRDYSYILETVEEKIRRI